MFFPQIHNSDPPKTTLGSMSLPVLTVNIIPPPCQLTKSSIMNNNNTYKTIPG